MSLILATINGPAFYPLPGIGRVFKVFDQADTAGLSSPKMKEYMECQKQAAKDKRDEILRLIQSQDRTLAEIAKILDCSIVCVKKHVRELKKIGVTSRREGATVYFCADAKDG